MHSGPGQNLGEPDYVGHGMHGARGGSRTPSSLDTPPVADFPVVNRVVGTVVRTAAPLLRNACRTVVYRPLVVPDLGTILDPFRRLGMRTPAWRYVTTEVTAPCQKSEPVRDGFGNRSLPGKTKVDLDQCRAMRKAKLFDQSSTADHDRDVASEHAEVVRNLHAAVRGHGDPDAAATRSCCPQNRSIS